MGYSPWGHKMSDTTYQLNNLKALSEMINQPKLMDGPEETECQRNGRVGQGGRAMI